MTIKKVTDIRRRIAALAEEREALGRRPRTREEAIDAFEQWLAQNADQFDVGAFVKHGEPVLHLRPADDPAGGDLQRVVATLFGDELRAYVIARIDQMLADADPISAEDAAKRREEIAAELLTLEREEEEIICKMRAAGETVARRGDADPRALLGLDDPPPRPAPLPREQQHGFSVRHPRSAVVGSANVTGFISGRTGR